MPMTVELNLFSAHLLKWNSEQSKYKTKNSKFCVRIKFGIKYMESSQFFFPIGTPKQFKMIVKLIRLYISLNVKNVKNLKRQKEKRNTKIRHLRTVLCGVGETNNLERFQLCRFFFFSFLSILRKRLCLWVWTQLYYINQSPLSIL